jgi:hypothetical protein
LTAPEEIAMDLNSPARSEPNGTVWVVSVLMGLGHLRAAAPLADIAVDGLLLYGSRRHTPPREYRIWKSMRRLYYVSSRVGRIPLIGKHLLALMLALERIPPYYPVRDQSRPNLATWYLDWMIRRRGLCAGLVRRIAARPLPVVHTFYATAIALDQARLPGVDNYLLICDADFNRVWVPRRPQESRLRYLAPCTQVAMRLRSYGVPDKNICMTGFPLPRENLGDGRRLEILRADLFQRLLRLDPRRKFFSFHRESVQRWLGSWSLPSSGPEAFTVMFAIGGAGAQAEMAGRILSSLAGSIRAGRLRLFFSAGIQRRVFELVQASVNERGLQDQLGRGIEIVFDTEADAYLEKFNRALRVTDVLWTKPSELSFYCGLGIPILLAPPIGTHEELNKRWLQEIHAGIKPPGSVECCHEWLFDLRDNGRLAEAAWDGFLKARKLGAFRIAGLLRGEPLPDAFGPLEQ